MAALLCAIGVTALALALVAGSATAASNLVLNASFEQDSDSNGIPDSWGGNHLTPADKRVCNQSYAGACSFKMVGDGTIKYFYQQIPVTGGAGDSYKFTFWIKGKAIPSGGDLSIFLFISDTDGSIEVFLQVVPRGDTAWKKYVLNATSAEPYDFSFVGIREIGGPSGKLWVDTMKLVRLP